MRRYLDKGKTENFIEMFRGKCREESTIDWIVNYHNNTDIACEITK
jgi:hypothetical protein